MSGNESHTHESFIKTPKQLIVVCVLSFVVPVGLILMLVQFLLGGSKAPLATESESVATRIKPLAEVTLAEAGGGKVRTEKMYSKPPVPPAITRPACPMPPSLAIRQPGPSWVHRACLICSSRPLPARVPCHRVAGYPISVTTNWRAPLFTWQTSRVRA